MRKGIWVFLAVVQAILLAAHFLVYETWEYFWSPASRAVKSGPAVVVVLAISFVTASLLSFKYWNSVTRTFYRAAAIWLGLFNFLFLAGDRYDGSYADLDALASPLRGLNAPLGNFFVAGNHEEMHNAGAHMQAAKDAGLRLLDNEKVIVDGMQIIGVHYHEASHPD